MPKVQTTVRLCLSPEFLLKLSRREQIERFVAKEQSFAQDREGKTLFHEITNVIKIITNANTLVEFAPRALYVS